MSLPYVIQILVTSGDPDGVRVVEKSNWTGKGIVFSRSDLAVAQTQGLASPGIYILVGEDSEENFEQRIYVGQGDDVGRRLKQHQGDDSKDDHYELIEDTLFRTPSAAALTLVGGPANGREAWKDTEGVTLKQRQIEEAGL